MKKILLVSSFFPLSIITISLAFFLLVLEGTKVTITTVTSLETTLDDMKYSPEDTNTQIETVKQFLSKYNSPLAEYARYIVEVSNTYDIDPRLIPAIAMQESNLCKKAPLDSYNCWGYGIYGGKITKFSNYKEGIERVAFTLSQSYVRKGYATIEQIMSRYTPRDTNNWASAVSHFMSQME